MIYPAASFFHTSNEGSWDKSSNDDANIVIRNPRELELSEANSKAVYCFDNGFDQRGQLAKVAIQFQGSETSTRRVSDFSSRKVDCVAVLIFHGAATAPFASCSARRSPQSRNNGSALRRLTCRFVAGLVPAIDVFFPQKGVRKDVDPANSAERQSVGAIRRNVLSQYSIALPTDYSGPRRGSGNNIAGNLFAEASAF
jgi:hypothetical protein